MILLKGRSEVLEGWLVGKGICHAGLATWGQTLVPTEVTGEGENGLHRVASDGHMCAVAHAHLPHILETHNNKKSI